jgi:hypothetical protein
VELAPVVLFFSASCSWVSGMVCWESRTSFIDENISVVLLHTHTQYITYIKWWL